MKMAELSDDAGGMIADYSKRCYGRQITNIRYYGTFYKIIYVM